MRQSVPDVSVVEEVRELYREKIEQVVWDGLDAASGLYTEFLPG